jgi:serine protease
MRRLAALPIALAAVAAVSLPTSSRAQAGEPGPVVLAGGEDGPTFADVETEALRAIESEIYVDLVDGASASDVEDVARIAGVPLVPNSVVSEVDKLEIARGVDPSRVESILARLRGDPRVEVAERGSVVYAYFVPNDPLYATKQWHLKHVGAETAWDYACGGGVTVAVVDTGVACYDKGSFSKGSDLQGTTCTAGWNFVDDKPEAWDDQGHGTHVAGTIAQTTNNGKGVAGLAHCATLMPVKVLSKHGYGSTADVAQGIRWAADHGAQVINLSLGGPSPSAVLEKAVQHARSKGVFVVAAAGNSGRAVGYPAAYPGVFAVSATDANGKIAWFSSRGPQVDLGAPGVAVTQQTVCNHGQNKCEVFGTFNGTSMAAPHVAGAAALLVGMGVTDADSIEATLSATATKKDDKNLYGAGILDAKAAVQRTFWVHLGLRLAALAALFALVAARIRQRRGSVAKTAGALAGALAFGVGILPVLPLLGILPRLGAQRWIGELVARPVGEWTLVFSAGLHLYLPLANAAPAFGLALVGFGSKRLRPFIGGAALGTAALMTQMAFSADVAFVLGTTAMRVLTLASGALSVWLARLALDRKD